MTTQSQERQSCRMTVVCTCPHSVDFTSMLGIAPHPTKTTLGHKKTVSQGLGARSQDGVWRLQSLLRRSWKSQEPYWGWGTARKADDPLGGPPRRTSCVSHVQQPQEPGIPTVLLGRTGHVIKTCQRTGMTTALKANRTCSKHFTPITSFNPHNNL